MQYRYLVFCALFMLLLGVAWGVCVYCFGPVLPQHVIASVLPGMTQEQVISLVGNPASVESGSFIYEKPFNPGYVQIKFNHARRVVYVNDESVFRSR